MEEKLEKLEPRFDIIEILRAIVQYFLRYWVWHVVFIVLAVVVGYVYSKFSFGYSSQFLLVQKSDWISKTEAQYIMSMYPRQIDEGDNPIRKAVTSITLVRRKISDQLEPLSSLEFEMQLTATRVINRDSLQRDLLQFLNELPYVQSIRALRDQALDIQIRYADSIMLAVNRTMKEVADLRQGERVLLDLRNERIDERVYDSKSTLQVKKMYLREAMFDVLAVQRFTSNRFKRFVIFTFGLFFVQALGFGLLKAVQSLVKPRVN